MNVQELLDLLADCDPDAEIRIGIQPGYPLRHGVAGVLTQDPGGDDRYGPDDQDEDDPGDVTEGFVWILANEGPPSYPENPYANRTLWELAER